MDDTLPPEPSVERVERADGRYLLYFSWPDDSAPASPPDRPELRDDDADE
jgi:hypothetical protein